MFLLDKIITFHTIIKNTQNYAKNASNPDFVSCEATQAFYVSLLIPKSEENHFKKNVQKVREWNLCMSSLRWAMLMFSVSF